MEYILCLFYVFKRVVKEQSNEVPLIDKKCWLSSSNIACEHYECLCLEEKIKNKDGV